MSRAQCEELFRAKPVPATVTQKPAVPREGHRIVRAVLTWPQAVGAAVREGYRSASLSRGRDYESFNHSMASFWDAAL